MATKAKFYVAEINKYATAVGRNQGFAEPAPFGRVVLRAATRAGNEEWASSTPSGEITMTINGPAFPWFESMLGRDVLVTLEEFPSED